MDQNPPLRSRRIGIAVCIAALALLGAAIIAGKLIYSTPPPRSWRVWRRMTKKGAGRGLTFGETLLVTSVFGGGIDAGAARLHRRKWWPLQPRAVVMSIGSIHFHPDSPDWSEDFTRRSLGLRAFLIHEMTHVWQHQRDERHPAPAAMGALSLPAAHAGQDVLRLWHRAAGRDRPARLCASRRRRHPRRALARTYAALLPFGRWLNPARTAVD